MTDWQTRVTSSLRQRGLDLPREVSEELAAHLEDAWESEHGPCAGSDFERTQFVARVLQGADLVALTRRGPAPPPAPEPGTAALLGGLGSELRYTARLLRRAPIYSVAVVTVIALGIAVTTAAFGLVHSALLAPLPYPDADRLVMVWEHNLARNRPRNVVNPGNFFAWSGRSRSIESAGLFTPTVGNLSGGGGRARRTARRHPADQRARAP